MPEHGEASAATRALEMRLSVPARGDLRTIANELAARIAEYLGAASPESLSASVEQLASGVIDQSRSADPHITFEFRQGQGELIVVARCDGQASEVRHPLPA